MVVCNIFFCTLANGTKPLTNMQRKFRVLVIILLAISVHTAFGQRVLSLDEGKITEGISPTVPSRDVDVTTESVTVTYHFNSAVLLKDDLYEGAFWWKVDGFASDDKPGYPSTLSRIDRIAIPFGSQAKVEILEASYKDFPIELAPARPPLTDSGNETYSKKNVIPINPSLGIFPKRIVETFETQVYRNNEILGIKVSPIQYDSKRKIIRAFTTIKYRVLFFPRESTSRIEQHPTHSLTSDDCFLSNTTINAVSESLIPQNASEFNFNFRFQQDYLIISTPKYLKAVETFAEWKRTLGFNVHIVLKDNWTSASVLASVKGVYRSSKNLCYLLIIGDHEDVPASSSKLLRAHVTDLFYGCMDGDGDYTPDIRRGRIPASTPDEALDIVDKIIQYESRPIISSSFYKRGLNCAYFQDNDKDGYADRRFAQTAEDVRNYLTPLGKVIRRAYFASKFTTPKNWNNDRFSLGEPLPAYLRKPFFKWDANKIDITSAINDGTFYVLHRDHGSVYGWGDPEYNVNDISSLSNGDKLPVVFSINCLTGKFNGRTCFAEAFLRKQGGGCVGILAATEISYSGYNDVLTGGLFDAIWPSPGLRIVMPGNKTSGGQTPTPSYRLGQVLDQGLARMIEIYGANSSYVRYTQEIFHYFGDPSMRIYTEVPTPFSGVKVSREGDKIRVVANEFATISFYDPKTNTVASYKGTSATFKTERTQDFIISVSRHNKIPYLDYGDIFIQNERIKEDRTYNGNVVKIGSRVTTSKPFGDVVFETGAITISGKRIEIYPKTTFKKESRVTLTIK